MLFNLENYIYVHFKNKIRYLACYNKSPSILKHYFIKCVSEKFFLSIYSNNLILTKVNYF